MMINSSLFSEIANKAAPVSKADSNTSNPLGGATKNNSLATTSNFLQMLVAQIKNQNPLNPTDGVQFLTQLSQFTQTEQTLGMRQDLAAIRAALEANPQPPTTTKP